LLDCHKEPYVSLATFRRDGREVRTPVWVAAEGERIFVYTNGTSGKVKRIRNNGRARLAACDARGRLEEEVWLDATARMLDDPAERAHGFEVMLRKYGWKMRLVLLGSRLGGRYRDRAVIELRSRP